MDGIENSEDSIGPSSKASSSSPSLSRGQDSKTRSGSKKRAKKPSDAPRRPKSAYMFFLAEFREEWKNRNPEQRKVSTVAQAAGEKWRSMTPQDKEKFQLLSNNSKITYKREMAEYSASKSPARRKSARRSGDSIKRPASAFIFFLQTFRSAFELEHPEQKLNAAELSQIASEKWKSMTPEEKEPYEQMSHYNKEEYQEVKHMSNLERMNSAAELAFAVLNNPLHKTDNHICVLDQGPVPVNVWQSFAC